MQLIIVVTSYILGSVPFGYIICRLVKGFDIRNHGSGNVGATNVARVVSKQWGIVVFILDFFKGFIPPMVLSLILLDYTHRFLILTALIPIIGHNWSIFLNFKGGKGVSTSVGALCGLCFVYPLLLVPLAASILVWLVVFAVYKFVSLASLVAAFSMFLLSTLLLSWEFKFFSFIILVLIIVRHKKNIKNLLSRKELHV